MNKCLCASVGEGCCLEGGLIQAKRKNTVNTSDFLSALFVSADTFRHERPSHVK